MLVDLTAKHMKECCGECHYRNWSGGNLLHYGDLIMSTMASQITSLTTVYSGTDKKNIKALCHWPLLGETTGNWWIPHTKGQSPGKCLHLMTSTWSYDCFFHSIQFAFASFYEPFVSDDTSCSVFRVFQQLLTAGFQWFLSFRTLLNV